MPKNWKGGPLGFLNTQTVVKYQRNWRGTLWREKKFRKKVSLCRKTERGDPFGFSNIHSDAKQQKIEGGTLWGNFFSEKSFARYCMLRYYMLVSSHFQFWLAPREISAAERTPAILPVLDRFLNFFSEGLNLTKICRLYKIQWYTFLFQKHSTWKNHRIFSPRNVHFLY